jgi:ElaB/YqjD/DUF883 family membrane-anchored ribosome-binding protein
VTRQPEEIRREIETTRDELADTAAALAYKADVKARGKERVEEVKQDMRAKVDGVKGTVTGKVEELKAKAPGGSSDPAMAHPAAGGAMASRPPSNGGSTKAAAAEQFKTAAHTAQVQVKQRPIESAAVAAAILGFALGYLIARRRAY